MLAAAPCYTALLRVFTACYWRGPGVGLWKFLKQIRHLACTRGGADDEHLAMLCRTFAVYITLAFTT